MIWSKEKSTDARLNVVIPTKTDKNAKNKDQEEIKERLPSLSSENYVLRLKTPVLDDEPSYISLSYAHKV